MMSLTFGLFTQVSGSGPLGPLVYGALLFCVTCISVAWSISNFLFAIHFILFSVRRKTVPPRICHSVYCGTGDVCCHSIS